MVTAAHPRTLLGAARAQVRPILAAWTDPDRPTSICLDRLRNTHFDRLGRISGQVSSFPASGPGIELPCRAQLTIGPGRFGQVSSFPAALGSPTIRLAKKETINLSTSLHRKTCNDLLASSGPCLVSSYIYYCTLILPFKAFQIIQNSEFGIFLVKIRIALYAWETY